MLFWNDTLFNIWNILFIILDVIFCFEVFTSFLARKERTRETLAFSLIGVFLDNTIFAFILAFFSAFSIRNLFFLTLIQAAIPVALISRNRANRKLIKPQFLKRINIVFLLVVLAAMFLYFMYPVHYLIARRDPALYTINGINISTTGGFEFHTNDFIDENYDQVNEFTDFLTRGFDSDYESKTSDIPSHMTSQFLHVFSSALAIGYSIGGYNGLMAIPALIGVLALLAAYYSVKEIFSRNVATMTSLFLLCCPAQIWGGRITQTEVLCQMIYILSMLCFYKGYKYYQSKMFILGSALLGFIGFVRIDSYLSGIGFILACLLLIAFTEYSKATLVTASVVYVLESGLSLLYTLKYSPYYFKSHWKSGYIDKTMYFLIGVLALEIVVILFRVILRIRFDEIDFLRGIASNKKAKAFIMIVFVALFTFCYSVRPLMQKGIGETVDADFSKRCLVEFCWYTTLLCIPLFFTGLWFLLSKLDELYGNLILLGTGFVNCFVYIYYPGIAPDHIWAARRWLSVCFIFVFILAAYGVEVLSNWLTKSKFLRLSFSLLTVVLVCSVLLYESRAFLFKTMLDGVEKDYAKLVKLMDDEDGVYLCETQLYSNYLRNVYNKNAFTLNYEGMEQLEDFLKTTDLNIYYVGDENLFMSQSMSISLDPKAQCSIEGEYLVQLWNQPATETYMVEHITNIYQMSYNGQG